MMHNSLFRLLKLSLPLWRGFALAMVFGALTILSSVGLMATSAWLISKASLQPSIAELGVAVVGVRFLGISRAVTRYLERLIAHDATFRLLARLRVEFYKAIEPLAPSGLMTNRGGDLLTRVVEDVENLQNLYLRAFTPSLIAILCASLVGLFIMSYYDVLVGMVGIVCMLINAFIIPLVAWQTTQKATKAYVIQRAELNARLTDHIQGMGELLLFGQVGKREEQIESLRTQLRACERQQAQGDALQLALSAILASVAGTVVLFVAIPRINGIDLASVTLATIAVFEAFTPLAQVATQIGSLTESANRLFEIADTPPTIIEPEQSLPLPIQPILAMDEVSFGYPSTNGLILENLSLRLNLGDRVAILGSSGAGKSTLINLLLRFWDYQGGHIRLNHQDLRNYDRATIYQTMAVMSQRTYLFNTSIRDNIRFARYDATDAEIEQATRQAQIHEFIMMLPMQYDTLVGENGVQLSGGQRQRIALARVLLSQAPIIILDEPTANLDVLTEKTILKTIISETRGRTLLLFTHRRTLLNEFDAVYWLDKSLHTLNSTDRLRGQSHNSTSP